MHLYQWCMRLPYTDYLYCKSSFSPRSVLFSSESVYMSYYLSICYIQILPASSEAVAQWELRWALGVFFSPHACKVGIKPRIVFLQDPVFALVCHLKLAAGGATMRMTVERLPGLPEDGRLEAAKRLFSMRMQ